MKNSELQDRDLERVTGAKEVFRLVASDAIGFGNTASVGNTWREYRDAIDSYRERRNRGRRTGD